jgi:hypothetical protein
MKTIRIALSLILLALAASIPSDLARAQNCAQDVNCPPAWSEPDIVTLKLKLEWKPIGRMIERGGRLHFPSVSKKAGIYRFDFKHDDYRALYVGETVNLERRFRDYGAAGRTQNTNNRLRGRMLLTLRAPGEVAVAIASVKSQLCYKTGCKDAEMPMTNQRRLLERAGILHGASEQGVELLNYDLPKSIRPTD